MAFQKIVGLKLELMGCLFRSGSASKSMYLNLEQCIGYFYFKPVSISMTVPNDFNNNPATKACSSCVM
jgi:hypothetical protein